MQREEKQLDSSLEALIQRVSDLKNSITSFMLKLEHEYQTLNWPSMLDNYALLSGQISSLNRLLRSDKMPQLRNHILLPLVLSPDRDAELEKVTEGRVPAFNHEVVPDYLRTKPEPEVEEKMNALHTRASNATQDLQKQINSVNKVTTNLIEMINTTREEVESEMNQKSALPQTTSQADTNTLIAAISFGKNLKPHTLRRPDSAGPPGTMPGQNPQAVGHPPPGYAHPVHGYYAQYPNLYRGGPNAPGPKAPSAIKTNIKSASSMHPYQRN